MSAEYTDWLGDMVVREARRRIDGLYVEIARDDQFPLSRVTAAGLVEAWIAGAMFAMPLAERARPVLGELLVEIRAAKSELWELCFCGNLAA